MSYADLLFLVAPETIVVASAFAILGLDLLVARWRPAQARMRLAALLATFACAAATARLLASMDGGRFMDGMLVIDPLTQWIKVVVLMLTVFTGWICTATRFTGHPGEYFAMLLLASAGMMFLVSTEHLLMLFVSLELLSVSLYILAAFEKDERRSAEAALKYFLIGGVSAACMLFGISVLYGVTNQLNLGRMAAGLADAGRDPLLLAGLVLVVLGFGFKVAAVPFHLWAPDIYQGAPGPSAAFIASGSKLASFFVLAKVLMVGFAGAAGSGAWADFKRGWVPLLAIVAGTSMVWGNLAAIAQKSVRRLLAYSAIAQAGYMLVGMLADNQQGLAALMYYAATYGATILGAFGVVTVLQEPTGDEKFGAFAGLVRRAPVLAHCMLVFLLSLAGIPPLAGFFGKFYLFTAALGSGQSLGLLWLVVLAVAMSTVSLYYYLQVLKQIYVAEAAPDAPALRAPFAANTAIVLLAVVVVVLGCAPNLALDRILRAIAEAGLRFAGQ